MATAQEFFGSSSQTTADASVPSLSGAPSKTMSAGDFFGGGEVKQFTPETDEEKLGFAKRTEQALGKRSDMALEIVDTVESGEIGMAEGLFQLAGKVGAGAVLDFIGEGVVSAGRGLQVLDEAGIKFISEPIFDLAKDTGVSFLNTDIGKLGLERASKTKEGWDFFKEENPRAARNIESVANVALLFTPVKAKAKPVLSQPQTTLGKAATKLEGAATEQTAAKQTAFLEDLVVPKQSAKVKLDQAARTTEEGILKQKKVALSQGEQKMVEELKNIPGVTPKNTLQGNLNAVRTELGKEADTLAKNLDETGVGITHSETRKSLDLAKKSLSKDATITGDAAVTAERLIESAMKIVRKNPPTSAGLLKSRKEFDKLLTSQKKNVLGNAPLETALTISSRAVRQTMNRLIQAKNPSTAVRTSLDKQTNMFRAMDNIAPKAVDEANNLLMRAWQNTIKLMPIKGQANQAMATSFGLVGLGTAAALAPVLTKTALLGGIAFLGGKAVLSAGAKKGAAQMIRQIDKGLKIATDPAMIKQLRVDKAAIVELTEDKE